MKKTAKKPSDDLRSEYDFKNMAGGVRAKYVKRLHRSSNVVVLDPEIAKAFPNQRAVNQALRELLKSRRSG